MPISACRRGLLPALLCTAPAHAAAPGPVQDGFLLALLLAAAVAVLAGVNRRLRTQLREAVRQRLSAENALTRSRSQLRERIEAQDSVMLQCSLYDLLTDLPNRSLLYERLSHATHLGSRDQRRFALLIIDLDRFKAINDTLGHMVGDSIIQEIAVRLQKSVHGADVIAYLGGDEFAILHNRHDDGPTPEAVAAAIQDALVRPFEAKELPLNVSASIGIALYPEHGADADNLLRYAEIAMYSAKRTQEAYALYDPAQQQDTEANLLLASELRGAVDSDDLVLHFQPKLALREGRIVGVEALVRWRHPREGLLAPELFIQLAEKTGLIRELTLRVVEQALQVAGRWRAAGIDLPIAVNLSVLNLQDPWFDGRVAELLDRYGLPARALEFEITESAAIEDPEAAATMLERLNALGFELSIDDFGTGYSSLTHLRRLPVSSVKIDKAFVLGMRERSDDRVIVRAIVDLAHNLGLRVVAEGVEEPRALSTLSAMGCDEAQGFLVTPPLDEDAFIAWLGEAEEPESPVAQPLLRPVGATV